jgi:hypothetical protein
MPRKTSLCVVAAVLCAAIACQGGWYYSKASAGAASQPAWVAAGTAVDGFASGAGNLTPGLPAGWAENDILIVAAHAGNASTTISVSGYTEIGNTTGTSNHTTYWFYKRATSSESAPTVAFTDRANAIQAIVFAYRGCITSGTPYEDATVTSGALDATPDSSTVTPVGDARRVISIINIEDDTSISSGDPPTNWTERSLTATGTGTDLSIHLHEYDLNPSSGVDVTGVAQMTISASEWTAVLTLCLIPQ